MALLTNINGKFSVSDAGAVTFNNAFTFPTADGTANYVLKTNGSGQLAWAADNYENYDYWTLQGDSAANVNINSTNTLKFIGGTYIDTSATWAGGSNPRKLTINHETTSRTDTTSTDAPAFGGTFEAVTSVTTNTTGHVTAIDVSTITIPTDPGGTVKGTGTATRVAFWSASDTITSDADLYWDNTNKRLGIGTTSPSATLNIKSLNSSNSDSLSDVITNSEFKLQYRADDLSSMYLGGLGSERGYLQSINNAENAGTSFSLNPYGGNVGIGTTSPATKLNIRSDASDDGILLEKSDGTDIARLFYDGTSTNARLDMFSGGSATIQLKANGITHFSGGNVGIGVASGIDANLRVDANSATLTQEILKVKGGGSGGAYGFLVEANNGDDLFKVDTLSYNSYFTNGNVGIGTTGPVNKLGIEVAANSNTKAINIYSKNTSPNSYTSIGSQYSISNTYVESEIRFGNETQSGGGSYLGFVAGGTNTGNTEKMRITSGGNVVINYNATGGVVDPVNSKFTVATQPPYNYANSKIEPTTATFFSDKMTNNDYNSILQLVSVRASLTSGQNSNGYLGFSTLDNSNAQGVIDAGRIAIVNENGVARNSPTALSFWTNTPNGNVDNTPATEKMRIGSSGDVKITTNGKFLQGVRNTGSATIDMIGFVSGTDTLQIKGGTSGAANAISFYDTGGFLGTWYNGNFGIGTTSPGVKLQVQHDQAAESNVIFMNNSTSAGAAIRLSLNVGNPAGDDPMISFNIGDGGLDWTMGVDNSDSDKFKISGGTDSHNPNLGTNDQLVIDSSGNLTMTGDVIAYSDKKLKKNIKTLDGSKVYKMRGVSFDRIDTGKASSGVIAQEIQKIAPELISESNDTLGVAYGNISGYLIEAIKELKAEIEELKSNKCNCNK